MLIAMNKILTTAHHLGSCPHHMLRMRYRLGNNYVSMLCSTRLYQLFSTSEPDTSINTKTNVNKNKRDSAWIYSTKHEQQLFRKAGSISLYSNVGRDAHNASMRLADHVSQAHIVITSQPAVIHRFLACLANKQQFSPLETSNQSNSSQIIERHAQTQIIISDQDYKKQTKTLQFDTQIQISKMIQLEKQVNKEQGESVNPKLFKQSKQLKQFMNFKVVEKILQDVKSRQGYPFVMELIKQLKPSTDDENVYSQVIVDRKIDMERLLELRKNGVNLLFLFPEESLNKQTQANVIHQLEQKQVPYEILPCTNQLITAIVSSGLPADRFSIEIYPTENLENLLRRRAKMKITMCFQIQNARLQELISAILKVLGSEHIVYLHGNTQSYYRGQISNLQQHLQTHPIKQKTAFLIMAPLIPQFNQSLNKEINMESHIRNQLQADAINPVEMEILMKKLEKYTKKQEVYSVDVYLMVAEMLTRLQDDKVVKNCLAAMFKFRSEEWVEGLMREGKKFVVIDHLQLGDAGRKQKKQKNTESIDKL